MQLGVSFSLLLATLLFAVAQVDAVPVKRSPRAIKLPLKRLSQQRDVHPTILLQQHINRSHRRHARMNGFEGPSSTELARRLQKRLTTAEFQKYDKRFNRIGVDKAPSSDGSPSVNVNGANTLVAHGDQHGDGVGSDHPNRVASKGNNTQNPASGQGFPEAGLQALNNGDITKANTPTTANSLGLNVEGNDVGYIATVSMGNPPRDFNLLMDSGSADLWVGAEGCQSEGGGDCGNHVFLGSQSSSTFQDSGKPFNVTYGSGQVAGNIVTDNLNIGGLALDKHVFGVALLESQDFSNDTTKFDGLMGLAQSTLSNQGVLTPVEALAKNGLISEAITSYKISRVSDGLNDGEITFGALDQTKFDPNTLVTFQNVNPQGFWEGAFTLSVDGQDPGLGGRTGILDTGTTLLMAPAKDAAAIHAAIPGSQSDGQGGFTIPCTTNSSVSLKFAGQDFAIEPVDLLFAPVDPNNLQGDCISSISSGNIGGPTQLLLGDVFLKNVYYSHNVNKNEISLAKLV